MRNGWFSKITGCWGQFCQHSTKDEAHKWIHEAEQLMAWPPRVENDCGDYCAAFSWLHPELPFAPFSFNGYKSGIMLAFEATDEVWSQVQCMAVADAFTSTRACCSCDDPFHCPFNGFKYSGINPGGYCAFGSDGSCVDDNCRALAAGCGVSLFDLAGESNCKNDGANGFWAICGREGVTDWGNQACSENDVRSGNCDVCRSPMWCDDSETSLGNWGSVRTPDEWIEEFWDRDGGTHFGVRQCRFKRTQREFFFRTMKQRFVRRQQLELDWSDRHNDHANAWNEINMYVDPNTNDLGTHLFNAFLGLIYVRTSGESKQLDTIRSIAAHWRALGKDVPIFAVNAEELEQVKIWTPGVLVDLLHPVYDFQQLEP